MTKSKTSGKTGVNVESSKYYTNRELSWIQFNERVLCEAEDESNPLLERVKFLSISASNLDEFFMVRVASLKDMINAGYKKPDIAGMTATKQLQEVLKKLHDFTESQYAVYNDCLLPLLEENGFNICDISELKGKELDYAERYFDEVVFPVLTPMAALKRKREKTTLILLPYRCRTFFRGFCTFREMKRTDRGNIYSLKIS